MGYQHYSQKFVFNFVYCCTTYTVFYHIHTTCLHSSLLCYPKLCIYMFVSIFKRLCEMNRNKKMLRELQLHFALIKMDFTVDCVCYSQCIHPFLFHLLHCLGQMFCIQIHMHHFIFSFDVK